MSYIFKVDKLVRDNMQDISKDKGIVSFQRTLSSEEFYTRLCNKLLEEAHEVIESASQEDVLLECADILEVLYRIAQIHGITPQDIEKARQEKRALKGGFDTQCYCSAICTGESVAADDLNYYLDRPDQYPQIDDPMAVDPSCDPYPSDQYWKKKKASSV
jgi:predicted house-cleaning noncanonical NTP pyrophosphatase (MazG superfamily)